MRFADWIRGRALPFLRKHWKLVFFFVLLVVAILLRKKIAELVPWLVAKAVQGKVEKPSNFYPVGPGHVMVRADDGKWYLADVGAAGVPSNEVGAIHYDPAKGVTVERKSKSIDDI